MTLSLLTSIFAGGSLLLVAFSFTRIWMDDGDDAAAHIMRNLRYGVMAMTAVLLARSGYWDVLQVVSGDHWPTIHAALGGQQFSAVFNLGILIPCYFWLRIKWWLVPEDQRHLYTWLTAWRYPPTRKMKVVPEKE